VGVVLVVEEEQRKKEEEDARNARALASRSSKEKILDFASSFIRGWRTPGVLRYALSYSCLNGINYAMFFWLPFYLRYGRAGGGGGGGGGDVVDEEALLVRLHTISMAYDLGCVMGTLLCGVVGDWLGKRAPVLAAFQILALFPILALRLDIASDMILVLVIWSCGALAGGASFIISSVVCADIARRALVEEKAKRKEEERLEMEKLKGGGGEEGGISHLSSEFSLKALDGERRRRERKREAEEKGAATAQVAGIVDGFGALGAALVVQVVSFLSEGRWGWDGVFFFLAILLLVSLLCTSGIVKKDVQELWAARVARRRGEEEKRRKVEEGGEEEVSVCIVSA